MKFLHLKLLIPGLQLINITAHRHSLNFPRVVFILMVMLMASSSLLLGDVKPLRHAVLLSLLTLQVLTR
ncbi:CLUMA_CG018769, isoform A [Clunio marinus]|uniref:CLUMA_CG018769, isoform A n=1 Tax=Clunio marinus TaxID=568069 RepID=A0A1J1J1V4_9DIPT|nr:CLUMA_CG018769, isoform A [Clunio marinus]